MARRNVVMTSCSPAEEVGPSWWPIKSTPGIHYILQLVGCTVDISILTGAESIWILAHTANMELAFN